MNRRVPETRDAATTATSKSVIVYPIFCSQNAGGCVVAVSPEPLGDAALFEPQQLMDLLHIGDAVFCQEKPVQIQDTSSEAILNLTGKFLL